MPCSSCEKYGSWNSRCGSTCITTPTTPGPPGRQRARRGVGPEAGALEHLQHAPPGGLRHRAAVDDAGDGGARDAAQRGEVVERSSRAAIA